VIDVKPTSRCPGWIEAERHLSRLDPVLGRIISAVGPCTLAPRRNYFACLCQSIITQQISTAVAVKIYERFRGLFPDRRPVPQLLLVMDEATLRGVGLSQQKAGYLRELARAFEQGRVPVRRLRGMSDEQVIEALTPLRGIGRWTVEMFLIFVLNRLDVLPVDDFGLRKGVQVAYRLEEMPTAEEVERVAEAWRPYRSIGTWYMWRGGAMGVLYGQAGQGGGA
jgi:DNA-3-methyladenine glycosylase II